MTQELTKQEAKLPVMQTLADMGFDASDILLPKILLLQGTSQLVNEGKRSNGDIIDSLSGEKLGDKNTPIEVAPISRFKTITVLEKGTGKFIQSIPYVGIDPQYEEVLDDGRHVNNFITQNFYVLPVKNAQEGEMIFPALVSFRSKSLKAGKQLNSHFLMATMNHKKPYVGTVMIGCSLVKNEKGTFHVFSVTSGKPTSQTILNMAKIWEPALSRGELKVHSTPDEELPPEELDTANAQY